MIERDDGTRRVHDSAAENYFQHGYLRVYADGSTFWSVALNELQSVLEQWRGTAFDIVTRDVDGSPLYIKRSTVTGIGVCTAEVMEIEDAYQCWRADRANAKNRESPSWQ